MVAVRYQQPPSNLPLWGAALHPPPSNLPLGGAALHPPTYHWASLPSTHRHTAVGRCSALLPTAGGRSSLESYFTTL